MVRPERSEIRSPAHITQHDRRHADREQVVRVGEEAGAGDEADLVVKLFIARIYPSRTRDIISVQV